MVITYNSSVQSRSPERMEFRYDNEHLETGVQSPYLLIGGDGLG